MYCSLCSKKRGGFCESQRRLESWAIKRSVKQRRKAKEASSRFLRSRAGGDVELFRKYIYYVYYITNIKTPSKMKAKYIDCFSCCVALQGRALFVSHSNINLETSQSALL